VVAALASAPANASNMNVHEPLVRPAWAVTNGGAGAVRGVAVSGDGAAAAVALHDAVVIVDLAALPPAPASGGGGGLAPVVVDVAAAQRVDRAGRAVAAMSWEGGSRLAVLCDDGRPEGAVLQVVTVGGAASAPAAVLPCPGATAFAWRSNASGGGGGGGGGECYVGRHDGSIDGCRIGGTPLSLTVILPRLVPAPSFGDGAFTCHSLAAMGDNTLAAGWRAHDGEHNPPTAVGVVRLAAAAPGGGVAAHLDYFDTLVNPPLSPAEELPHDAHRYFFSYLPARDLLLVTSRVASSVAMVGRGAAAGNLRVEEQPRPVQPTPYYAFEFMSDATGFALLEGVVGDDTFDPRVLGCTSLPGADGSTLCLVVADNGMVMAARVNCPFEPPMPAPPRVASPSPAPIPARPQTGGGDNPQQPASPPAPAPTPAVAVRPPSRPTNIFGVGPVKVPALVPPPTPAAPAAAPTPAPAAAVAPTPAPAAAPFAGLVRTPSVNVTQAAATSAPVRAATPLPSTPAATPPLAAPTPASAVAPAAAPAPATAPTLAPAPATAPAPSPVTAPVIAPTAASQRLVEDIFNSTKETVEAALAGLTRHPADFRTVPAPGPAGLGKLGAMGLEEGAEALNTLGARHRRAAGDKPPLE